jgi:hypothetical protein
MGLFTVCICDDECIAAVLDLWFGGTGIPLFLLFAMLLVDRMVGGALPGLSIDLSAGG